MSNREQQLVNIAWQMVAAVTADPVFCKKSQDEKAEWFAKTLTDCGFPNRPIGSSYHVLTDKPGNEFKVE